MSNEVEQIVQQTEALLRLRHEETLQETTPQRLHECLGEVVMVHINDNWVKTKKRQTAGRRAFYFSAEYLVGRLVYSNLFNLGILSEVKKAFAEKGVDLACLEEIEDAALGNGGLGRRSGAARSVLPRQRGNLRCAADGLRTSLPVRAFQAEL